MSLNQNNLDSVQDTDGSTIDTAITPPETIPPDLTDDNDDTSYPGSYLVPKPGSTFIIRSVSSRDIITLLKGRVVLEPPGSLGSPHWECVETGGWLGFRNVASDGLLVRDQHRELCCIAKYHLECEQFHIGSRSEGGYVLLMIQNGELGL